MIIERKHYLQKMKQMQGKPFIKVITGQRRVGKSTLIQQLVKDVPSEKLLFLDMEQKIHDALRTEESLYVFLKEHCLAGKQWICIDEIQNIAGWERTILSIFSEFPAFEIWLTGSNSTMLSSSLTTLLRGRYWELHVYPFLFDEFCLYYGYTMQQESFIKFMERGGFPGTYRFDTYEEKQDLTKQIIYTVLLKDIIEKYAIREVKTIQELLGFFINNIGNITNIKQISDWCVHQGIGITHTTLQQYVNYLELSYLIYPIELYDIQGKKMFDRLKKWYCSDHSWRKYLFGSFDPGMGKVLENIVCMTCKRAGWSVQVGRIKQKEIDFVIEKNGTKKYLQVAYLIADNDVFAREFGNLKIIDDNYEKRVITLDPVLLGQHEGIKHVQIRNLDKILAN